MLTQRPADRTGAVGGRRCFDLLSIVDTVGTCLRTVLAAPSPYATRSVCV